MRVLMEGLVLHVQVRFSYVATKGYITYKISMRTELRNLISPHFNDYLIIIYLMQTRFMLTTVKKYKIKV